MYIKICGITKLDQAQAIAQMAVKALGFICVANSPRYINNDAIAHITSSLDANLDFVGVFLNAAIADICQTVQQSTLNAVQLHGDESSQFCQDLRSSLNEINPNIKLIKALRVKDQADLTRAKLYSDVVDVVLLDAYDPDRAGGTGKTIDWQMLREFQPHCDWWLAGGLSPANVAEAIALTMPNGLDVSSGVEHSAGNKDLDKVRQFMAIASKF